jgi:hypothetical protein
MNDGVLPPDNDLAPDNDDVVLCLLPRDDNDGGVCHDVCHGVCHGVCHDVCHGVCHDVCHDDGVSDHETNLCHYPVRIPLFRFLNCHSLERNAYTCVRNGH